MGRPLHLYDTLAQTKKLFQPLGEEVKMYCCGVTPYSHTHIGHARTFFAYDLLWRALKDHDYAITAARNITDIDDKIINRANLEGVSCCDIVNRFVSEQNEFLEKFDLLKPDKEPKVTESMNDIVSFIAELEKKGKAYVTQSGVYFRVRNFKDYGKLSKNDLEKLRHGVRIAEDESKEDSADFALWKFAKEEPHWPSPWGPGRPGWHIECSAMIFKMFGEQIDIHMGGRDLIFPHHEAEIAQSESLTSKPFASIWMHVGIVTLYGEKMSKSTNQFVSLSDFLEKYPAEVLRFIFLSAHYSQPLDFTYELAQENLKKLAKCYRFLGLIESYQNQNNLASSSQETETSQEVIFASLEILLSQMQKALDDDLNTALALSFFFEFVKEVNLKLGLLEKAGKSLSTEDFKHLAYIWPQIHVWLQKTLGILKKTPSAFFEELRAFQVSAELSLDDIEKQILRRNEARLHKDWSLADDIRKALLVQGVQLNDGKTKTTWTVLLD